MKKRSMALLMAFVMILGFAAGIPGSLRESITTHITAEAANTTLSALKAKYPHNSKWTGTSYGAKQCMGYASQLAYELYGGNFKYWKRDTDLSTLKPGDIILSNYGNSYVSDYEYHATPWRHTIMVVKVNGENIEITQCNSGGRDLVTWNVAKTKSYYRSTLGWGKNSINGVYHAPSEALWETTPSGSVMTTGAGKTVPEGDYWIKSEIAADYYVDFKGTEYPAANGTNAEMYKISTEPESYDVFHLQYLDNGFYRITQYKQPDVCLDVSGASALRGANVQAWSLNNSTAQQWSIEATTRGFKIRARCNGFYLDVSGQNYATHTNLSTWTGNDSKSQYFTFVPYYSDERPIKNDTYHLNCVRNNSMWLDCAGYPENFKAGTNVALYNQSDDSFDIVHENGGYYRIIEHQTGLCVELDPSPTDRSYTTWGVNVRLNTKSDSSAQLWMPQQLSDGSFYFINKYSGGALDTDNGKMELNTNVCQFPRSGANSQHWMLVPAKKSLLTCTYKSLDGGELTNLGISITDGKKQYDYDDFGGFLATELPEGTYTVTISADTYVTRQYTVNVSGLSASQKLELCHPGDTDGNGVVNTLDVVKLKRHLINIEPLTGYALDCANTDGNDTINTLDVVKLKRHLINIEPLW